jgi:hypothetical protein
MKTNNFFDLGRFIGLMQMDFLFNYKFYLSFILGLNIGIYLFSYLMIRNAGNGVFYMFTYYILYCLMLGAMMVFIGMSFPAFRNQVNTGYYLLVPGSAFEKMLVQLVVRFVLFIPLTLILLKVGVFLAILSMTPDPKTGFDPLFVDQFSYSALFMRSGSLWHNLLRDLACLFFAFAGSAYFKRYAFVKTLGAMVSFPGILFLFIKLTGGQINWTKIGMDYLYGYNFNFIPLNPLLIGLLLLSLPWAYFKLKEKEL